MKSESAEWESQLAAATSRRPVRLDGDAAVLRENFLVLGHALEAATTERHEQRLLESLHLNPPANRELAVKSASGGRRRVAGTLVLATLATAVLLAVGISWIALDGDSSGGTPMAKQLPPLAPENSPPVPEVMSTSADKLLAWDDSLEDAFVAIRSDVNRAGGLAGSADIDVELLRERIQSAANEFAPASL